MTIIYLGNFENPFSDSTEKHIKFAFEKLGHKVIPINEKDFDVEKISQLKGDLFLFHKGGQAQGVELSDLIQLLNFITCKKVFWYFDKIWGEREMWMETIIPFVNHGFLTDETWLRRHDYKNVSVIRQGIGNENVALGKPKAQYKCDIAFLGNVYGRRKEWVEELKKTYGSRFKVFNNIFGRDLYDFCASCKIILSPLFPEDDFYWSSRIYMILGSGGFLIHPRLEGLKEEFTEKKHFVGYKTFPEMMEKIDYYLKNPQERKLIQIAGYKYCISHFTYLDRVKKLLEIIK